MDHSSIIRRARRDKGWTQTELAQRAGVSQTTIEKIENGKTVKSRHLPEILAALGLDYNGSNREPEFKVALNPQQVKTAHVHGETGAGLWREEEQWDMNKYPDVPYVPGRYSALEQKAYRVVGPSMDMCRLRLFDGDFIICISYFETRMFPQDRDIVVVTERNGHLVSRTVKEVEVHADRVELWPRSSNAQFQSPITIPRTLDPDIESNIEITDLVIGVFRPDIV